MKKSGTIYHLLGLYPDGMVDKLVADGGKRFLAENPKEYDTWRSNARTQCQESEAKFFRDLNTQGFDVSDPTIEQRIEGSEIRKVEVREIRKTGDHPLIQAGRIEGPWIYVFNRELDNFLASYCPK